ncbi:hypothetical protein ALQ60_200157 [Pseudomonas syringae pv. papulans]|nr:hypothetical protein ALO65_200294 [Pseudomonas syringae pv. papulans]RMN44630.1 hypothetical protein ALQ60_200157 [Pseudomonas syringae pv. papulans]
MAPPKGKVAGPNLAWDTNKLNMLGRSARLTFLAAGALGVQL